MLRDRSHEYFNLLNELNIPVFVFSAGLGNSVASVMKQAKVLHSNLKIISNFFQYKDGMLNGLKKPMVDMLKTNEIGLVRNRDHIFVIGDSLTDANMANGAFSSSHIIKIGFLNLRVSFCFKHLFQS